MKASFLAFVIVFLLGQGGAYASPIDDITGVSDDVKSKLAQDYADSGSRCQNDYTAAVSEDGSWGSVCSSKASDDDLARGAIQKCEHWSGGQPCGVVILRNKAVTYDLSPILMTYPTAFDAMEVPFVWAKEREKLAGKYSPRGQHKAIAITRNGTYGWVVEKGSAEEAKEEALKDCESRDKKGRCFIYSVDDQVLFNQDTNIYPER